MKRLLLFVSLIVGSWCCLFAQDDETEYYVYVYSADDNMGYATLEDVQDGDGYFTEGTTVTIEAVPNGDCYTFSQWSDGSTENPRTITVTADEGFGAYFTGGEYNVYVWDNDDNNVGYATLDGVQNGDDYFCEGTIVTIEAVATEACYSFDHWSDGSTENPRNITVTADVDFGAYFTGGSYSVFVWADDEVGGGYATLDGVTNGADDVCEGTVVTIEAVVTDNCYTFSHWSDGSTENPRNISVTDDVDFVAYFVGGSATIGAYADTETGDGYALVEGLQDTEVTRCIGSTVKIEAVPNGYYVFDRWDDGNTENPRYLTVTENTDYYAYFVDGRPEYTITVASSDSEIGDVEVCLYNNDDVNYESCGKTQTVREGTTVALAAWPKDGWDYRFVGWNDGNTEGYEDYRRVEVTHNMDFTANFERVHYNTLASWYYGTNSIGTIEYTGSASVYSNNYIQLKNSYTNGTFVTISTENGFIAGDTIIIYHNTTNATNANLVVKDSKGVSQYYQKIKNYQDTIILYNNTDYVRIGYEGTINNSWGFGVYVIKVYGISDRNTYSVVGEAAILNTEDDWEVASTANDMYWIDKNTYELYIEDVVLNQGTYEYKFVSNHQWGEYENPTNGNHTLVVPTPGKFDIDYILNPVTGNYSAELIPVEISEQYTVTVAVNDASMGKARVCDNNGTTCNTTTLTRNGYSVVTISATANNGYRFVAWSDGNTNAIRQLSVLEDITYTAVFEPVTPREIKFVPNGIGESGGKYAVWYWYNGGNGTWSDFLNDNDTLSITLPNDMDYVIFAHFASDVEIPDWNEVDYQTIDIALQDEKDTYTLTSWNKGRPRGIWGETYWVTISVQSDNTSMGTVEVVETSNNDNNSSSSIRVCAGEYVTFIATPQEGYQFAYWSNGSTEDETVIAPFADMTLTAYFITEISEDYVRVGETDLYYKQSSGSIDIKGEYNGTLYRSTYGDGGYSAAIQVDGGTAKTVDCYVGGIYDGVRFTPSVQQQGGLARMVYTLTNTNATASTISLGAYADVMIGENDAAPIRRRIDLNNSTYGLTMLDGNGAQLCVLFGAGLSGVTPVSDFWFGYYNQNNSENAIVGNYTQGDNYMTENGSYDSGMGWCWKDITIEGGATKQFAVLIGVGEVNLTPYSDITVTPLDHETWNDLSVPHQLQVSGTYNSPAGLAGVLEYAVETSNEWTAFTDALNDGDTFGENIEVLFDSTQEIHTVRFRTRDNVGNTANLAPVQYADVKAHPISGIEDFTYDPWEHEPFYQANLSCDLVAETQYNITNYQNNINAGTASFDMVGVFPYTIGRKTYNFTINPCPITEFLEIYFDDDYFVYNGKAHEPKFTLVAPDNFDYTHEYTDNIYPGEAMLTITGQGNYTGSVSQTFEIDKAPFPIDSLNLILPDSFLLYDGELHAVEVGELPQGVGDVNIRYLNRATGLPDYGGVYEEGEYEVYISIDEGEWYYGLDDELVYTFEIFNFSQDDWAILQEIYADLSQRGSWTRPWDLSGGIASVKSISDIEISDGHVVSLWLNNSGLTGTFPASVLKLPYLELFNLSDNSLEGNIEDVVAQYAAQGKTGFETIGSINISNNNFIGNIGIFAAAFTNLYELYAQHNKIEFVHPMISTTVKWLDLTYQELSTTRTLDLTVPMTIDMYEAMIPEILTYDHFSQLYSFDNVSLSLADNVYLNADYYSDDFYCYWSGNGTLDIASGESAVARDVNINSSFNVKVLYSDGDANIDSEVDVLDLQLSLNYIFEMNSQPFNYQAADLFADSLITVQDIVLYADRLLADNTIQPAPKRIAPAYVENDKSAPAQLTWKDGELHLYSEVEIAALDILVSSETPIKWNTQNGQVISTKENGDIHHAVVYSPVGVTYPALTDIVIAQAENVTDNIKTLKAVLSDIDAQRVAVSLNGASEVITALENEFGSLTISSLEGRIIISGINDNCAVMLYDMTGKLMSNRTPNALTLEYDVPQGVYLITLYDKTSNKQSVRKITVK